MKINIINLDKDRWILTKFAKNLGRCLQEKGHEVILSKKSKADVDVNHFIIFLFQKEREHLYKTKTVNTTMLTHVNDEFRFNKLKAISKYMDAGIAFSKDHMDFIASKSLGLKKLFYILPPHDNDLKLKKIHLGFFTNLYNDGRKKEKIFIESIKKIDPELIKLSIIGKGWKNYIYDLKNHGYEINYQRFFFRRCYLSKLHEIDFLLYLGNDEGSMSFLDAIQMGLKTIMIPQGFQKDLQKFITHKVNNDFSNLTDIFKKVIKDKSKFIAVRNKLTWDSYAEQHLKIWKLLLKNKNL